MHNLSYILCVLQNRPGYAMLLQENQISISAALQMCVSLPSAVQDYRAAQHGFHQAIHHTVSSLEGYSPALLISSERLKYTNTV